MNNIDIQDFLSFVTVKKGLAKNSIKHCKIRVAIYLDWVRINEKEVSKKSVEEFLLYLREEKRLNNNSLNTYIFAFRMLKDYCLDRDLPSNFLDGLKSFKKVKPVITILTLEEIDKLLSAEVEYGSNGNTKYDHERSRRANKRYGILTRFLALTGCRLSEATDLKKKYIDFGMGTVTFIETKNREYRHVFIGQPLLNQLYELVLNKDDDEYVFTNDLGKQIIPTNYGFYLQKLTKAAGIKKRVHPHVFRHSMATQLLMEGVDVTMVATLLGHKDIQTTFDNYVHLADTTIKKAQFKHPLLRKSLSTKEILTMAKETIEKIGLDDDRFEIQLGLSNDAINFSMRSKAIFSL